jgi:hypothetical protein
MPPHKPTEQQRKTVKAMSAYGIPQHDIARVLGIHDDTLREHYRDELDKANAEACARVAENLFRKATGDGRESVTAAIFWLKTRARWKETSVQEHTGPDGGPIEEIRRIICDPKVIDENA